MRRAVSVMRALERFKFSDSSAPEAKAGNSIVSSHCPCSLDLGRGCAERSECPPTRLANLGLHFKNSTPFAAPVHGLYMHGNLSISPRCGDERSIAKIAEGDVRVAPGKLPLNFG